MKKLYLILLLIICSIPAVCQNTAGKADDLSRLVLTPCVVSNSSVPSYAAAVLNNKLNQIVTKHGVGGMSPAPRFVITANLMEISKEITATAPPMIAMILSPTIYIGDAETGDLYASCQVRDVKGVGNNETKAYLDAIKKININSPEVVECINKGKTRIIEYYNSQIDFLLAEAESLVQSQKFEDAMALLATVPDVCKEAYEKAMAKISDVYQKKIDVEGAVLYNEAYALWKSSKSKDTALQVVELLAQINPLSASAKQGRTLVSSVEAHWAEIEAHRRAIEQRNWEFKMRQYEDEQAFKNKVHDDEYALKNKVHDDEHAARTAQRELDHEYRMQSASYDHDVQMKRAETGADAANMALNEVKEVVKVMSDSRPSFDYDAQMRRAEAGYDAASMALNEVKDVVKMTSKSANNLIDKLGDKIASWL